MDFERTWADSRRKLFGHAMRLTLNRADAEDLLSETCFRCYRRFEDFAGDRPFFSWAARIMTNVFKDSLRTRSRRPQTVSYDALEATDLLDLIPAESACFDTGDGDRLLAALVECIGTQHAGAIVSCAEEEPYQDIAARTGMSVGTIRSRLHRARHKAKADETIRSLCAA